MNAASPIKHNFPRPRAPISPVLSGHSCSLKKQTPPKNSVFSANHKIEVSSGRAAIALALEHAGISKGDEVLVPAYHCESMISPVRWRKATPIFFKINKDTSINIDDICNKITSNTQAIIATHYFGFMQNLTCLRKMCDEKNILLIEDCAHAFFGEKNGVPVGSTGDYAIASSMKFFPVYDGGLLISNKHNLDSIGITNPPSSFELKSALNSIEKAIEFSRMGLLGKLIKILLSAKSAMWSVIKKLTKKSRTPIAAPSSSEGGQELNEAWLHKRGSYASRLIVQHSSYDLITEQRQKNYATLDKALSALKGINPLFRDLPADTTPLVYPVYVDQPDKYFAPLKNQGVPIWRFGEYLDSAIDEILCANSVKLSAHIFQFPCHQELTNEEIEWMINVISKTFKEPQGSGS